MAKTHLPPHASALMQAIRGVGYDVKSAIADLIDNSIAARAGFVQVDFHWDGRDSIVSLLDDGDGMDTRMLEQAMTLGSRNPLEVRSPTDLGRFGLGLKTASLSQCSRLLVASKRKHGDIVTRIWDLDQVAESNDWVVDDEPNPAESALIARLQGVDSGTLVIWNRLDRLVGDANPDDVTARLHYQRTAREIENHLAMTFHRYLEGSPARLKLNVNGSSDEHRVKPWDPFCQWHSATQEFAAARRQMQSGAVVLTGFVLPHKDRFETTAAFELAGGSSGWAPHQGFYVYRNERLLVPGSWLGLGRPRHWNKDEQHKLARIRLDLPTALDAEWQIDVKKSKAAPPLALRDWLTRNADGIRAEAREVFVHRGSRAPAKLQAEFCPLWFADAGASARYRINRAYPAVSAALSGDPASKTIVEQTLRLLEATVPIHRIWLDVAEKPEEPPPTKQQLLVEEVATTAAHLLERLMTGHSLTRIAALQRMRHLEPFDQYPEVLAALEAQ